MSVLSCFGPFSLKNLYHPNNPKWDLPKVPSSGGLKASLTFICMTEHLFPDFSYSIPLATYL